MTGEERPRREPPASVHERQAQAVEQARRTNRDWSLRRGDGFPPNPDSWKRETKVLPREEARAYARNYLKKYPRAAYWSEVESWRVLEGDVIEFTMRRLPSAD